MDLSWYAPTSQLQVKTLNTLKSKGFGYPGSHKKIPDTLTKWLKSSQFQKGQPTPCKTTYAFPWVESFGHKSTPSDRPWIKAYCPKFLASTKMGGA